MDPLLDPDILEDFDYLSRKQGRDVYAEMIGRLERSWPERKLELAHALSQGASASVARGLHALKGTAASLGLRRLARQVAEAEHRALDAKLELDLDGLEQLLQDSLEVARTHRCP